MDSTTQTPPAASLDDSDGMYARWAAIFRRAHEDTNSIPLALAVLDTIRARESARYRALAEDDPNRVVRVAAGLFHVPFKLMFDRCRHSDVTSARYVAAWIFRRRHWSLHKIARFFSLDHSTIVHGLRKVDSTAHLLFAAHKADKLLELDPDAGSAGA
jgi:chromosomal replication initiation ATPase DnaA